MTANDSFREICSNTSDNRMVIAMKFPSDGMEGDCLFSKAIYDMQNIPTPALSHPVIKT
jgi:hypothetical protein